MQELFEAVGRGDLAAAQALVAARPELVNSRNEQGTSLVLFAIYNGRPEVARLLRKAGADIGIFEAAALGDLARIDELVAENGGALSAFSPDGFQPLGLACFFKHEMTARYLIEKGADPNTPSRNDQKVTALHSAVASNEAGITKALLEAGARTDVRQQGGYSPLHGAAASGNRELVEILLQFGADRNAKTDKEETAADIARSRGFAAVAELLDKGPG
jgi:ankyrin repeat protein